MESHREMDREMDREIRSAPSLRLRLLSASAAGAASTGVGAGGRAVLGEDVLELQQRGVGSNPRGVKVGAAHPEARLREVLQEPVEPAGGWGRGTQTSPSSSSSSSPPLHHQVSTDLGIFIPRMLCLWML